MRREVFGRQQVDRRACEPTHLRTRALSHEGCRGESAWTSPAALAKNGFVEAFDFGGGLANGSNRPRADIQSATVGCRGEAEVVSPTLRSVLVSAVSGIAVANTATATRATAPRVRNAGL